MNTVENVPVSHAEIIERNGGSTQFATGIAEPVNNVKAWKRNDSIPAAYWLAVVDAGFAGYKELAEAAQRRLAA